LDRSEEEEPVSRLVHTAGAAVCVAHSLAG
jgi:hypothetical protein